MAEPLYWEGKSIEEYTKEELVVIVTKLAKQNQRQAARISGFYRNGR